LINRAQLLVVASCNDGGLKRQMELPTTGWLRRYRVRAHGHIHPDRLAALAKGITVNVIAPGYVNTDMMKDLREDVLQGIIDTIPVGRLGEPEEIADSVVYLASEKSAFITGATLTVNGAQYIAS
jgi:hypothetical protein